MMLSDTQIAKAVYAAIDWLEAHPDRARSGAMATNKAGKYVHPSEPDAYCFCFIGRVAKEIGVPAYYGWESVVSYHLRHLGLQFHDLLKLNDNTRIKATRFAVLRDYIDTKAKLNGWSFRKAPIDA